MKVVAIMQARMGSTRLPGKVLKPILSKPLLEYQIERVKQSKLIDELVVATTTKPIDEEIVHLCRQVNCHSFRGSEKDVLSRYYEAAQYYEADVVVRLTSDCPLLDPEVIDQVIQQYLKMNPYHYVTNTLERTFPRGMDTEVFSMNILNHVYQNATAKTDREHVTSYIRKHSNSYNLANVFYPIDQSQYRLTVDTLEDFNLIQLIIETLYLKKPNFTLENVLQLLNEHPEWAKINAHVEQKKS
ncbi:cytidylyltransferase domain-containing protein [Tenuibacillus multivorans]|uniref:Spore coat polysaccharide biosynthesis protein SpsF n=1 Tax=Tenuibacillus multivorans TaxID=237069 RepID=A0A1G9YQ61_9BACI|nr:glycosyltransferase family protein [Tenuibacillus multivorans]GEL78483.1 3-deoxy-manno-octulosonate cytidylyltransferase [Tenuibacillus multivorans]SDN10566.1 spore coat polysaccharide biosynthesis protein SpsF [Tenuibacillus multivorans]